MVQLKDNFFNTVSSNNRTIDPSETSQGRYFVFGREYTSSKKELVKIDLDSVANAHVLFAGKSQSGKTTTLKKLIEHMGKEHNIQGYSEPVRKTGFIIDYSNDLFTKGEHLITIKGRKSNYGISLFKILDKSPESGGIKVQRDRIIKMLDRYFFSSKMGNVQSSALSSAIMDTYKLKGINDEDESTWDKEPPTVKDLQELIELIIASVESSLSTSIIKRIKRDGKKIRSLDKKIDSHISKRDILEKKDENSESASKHNDSISALEDERSSLYNDLKGMLNDYLDYQIYGEEANGEIIKEDEEQINVDINYYSEKNVFNALKGLRAHISKIVDSGAFNSNHLPIVRGVNRFNLSLLALPLQKLFTDLLCQEVFETAKSKGIYRERKDKIPGWKIEYFIAIDEAKLIIPDSKIAKESKDEPINRIVSESLKNGLCLLLSSQKLSHFSGEQLTNIHTKVIFELGQNDKIAAKSLLGLKDEFNSFNRFGVGLVGFGTKKVIPTLFPHSNLK